MRLWHENLLKDLPRQQLLGQHRECCALRGRGWGRPHATVDYVFTYSPIRLVTYHLLVMAEMEKRGYKPDQQWKNPLYRGSKQASYDKLEQWLPASPIYPEHNQTYLIECVDNLLQKGITVPAACDLRRYHQEN